MAVQRLELQLREGLSDAVGSATAAKLRSWVAVAPERVRTRKVFHLDLGLSDAEAERVLAALRDPVAEEGVVGCLADGPGEPWVVTVAFLPGVTDAVGRTVARAAEDCLGRRLQGQVYTSTQFRLWGLTRAEVERAATEVLHNPLIQSARVEQPPRAVDLRVPVAGAPTVPAVERVPLRGLDDAALDDLSRRRLLALTVPEMRVIASHFAALERDPTDAELECLAQTWSEHCKHKIFRAPIHYVDPEGREEVLEEGLFQRYVRGATDAVARARRDEARDPAAEPFLVSVFHDNAGVVRFTAQDHLVYKVETHNSPSALDPYGGALTGIVGVNRDSFGTGLGADLLANVWGYCFGPPAWDGKLPAGLMHPRRIREGVHHGVIDGGNQSGIPYARGWELFDPRFLGKPLVFCGTVAVMPVGTPERPTDRKRTAAGDKIVMVGGRIGKDGIHGATFSSRQLDESAPVQAVQLGDPITQKMMFDALAEARDRALFSGMTDNGAGGLSSSVGEMAEASGGARIDLALAPLKYPGLAPWEILVSEAQERMTLAVPPAQLAEFLELCARREVEATVLGEFTTSGRLEVVYGDQPVADLELEFLHDGLPMPRLEAVWSPPARALSPRPAQLDDPGEATRLLLALLRRPGLASLERWGRHYDHEVKGLSVIKPWVGAKQDVASTATVLRVRHGRPEGVVLGEGVHPWYSDLDTRAMALAAVDEAVRRVLCAGARWDRIAALDNFCWPDPIVGPSTPDGRHKLAQLVRCCQGLREACEAYGVPLVSGKDSMKNDAVLGGVKISIPPTLLVSAMGQLEDVARATSLQPRAVGEVIVLVGDTREELGGSELLRLLGSTHGSVPETDLTVTRRRYAAFAAQHAAGRVGAAHVVGRGGLAVALAHLALAGELGIDVILPAAGLPPVVELFAESTGRIVACVAEAEAAAFASAVEGRVIGRVAPARDDGGWLRVASAQGAAAFLDVSTAQLRTSYANEEGAT